MRHSEEFFFNWSCLHPKIIFCKPLEQHLKRIRLFCLGLSCTMPLNWVNGKKVSSSEGNLIFSFHLLQDGGAISYFQNIFDFWQKYLRNSFLAAASAASISGSIFFPTHATVLSYLLNRAAASIYHALESSIKNGCPNLSQCSYYLNPGGRAKVVLSLGIDDMRRGT